MNLKKQRVNPYLFVLLKRMLEYEMCGIGQRPTKLQIAHFVYARWKKKEYKNTSYDSPKELRDPSAVTRADSIRKDLFTPKKFEFSPDKLNQLAEEICIIDSFTSWDDYVRKYQDNIGAKIAERDYISVPFSELDIDAQESIFAWVEMKLLRLHLEFVRNDKPNQHQIIRSTEEFVIRTINKNEISSIIKSQWSTESSNDEARMNDLYEKNPNVFYIYKDDYDLWGYISVYPIKKDTFRRLKSKKEAIVADDIYTPSEKEKVKYIYVEDCFFKNSNILYSIINELKAIISIISDLDKIVTICSGTHPVHFLNLFWKAKGLKISDNSPIIVSTESGISKTYVSSLPIVYIDAKTFNLNLLSK